MRKKGSQPPAPVPSLVKKENRVLFSSASVEWYTPTKLYQQFVRRWGPFTLDPCATKRTTKCQKFYTQEQDGLLQSWAGEGVFCNSPYGRQGEGAAPWVEKGFNSVRLPYNPSPKVLFLLPARTETEWWQDLVEPGRLKGLVEVRFLRGRVCFGYCAHTDKNGVYWPECLEGNPRRPAGFPSAAVIFRPPGSFEPFKFSAAR